MAIPLIQTKVLEMIKTKMVEKEVEELEDVTCDVCGISCIKGQCGPEYVRIDKIWGFDSNKDGEIHKAEICEECWDRIVRTMEIRVQVSHYM